MRPQNPALKRAFSVIFQIRCYSAPGDRAIPSAKQKYVSTTGTYPKGFLAGSSHAGVKASNTKYDDIALVVSEQPCPASGVFTRNLFPAAPVQVSRQLLAERQCTGFRGVVVNSGCANAVTGKGGVEDAETMSKTADELLDPGSERLPQTLVMSTGVIGQRLPIDKITNAIPKAHASLGSTHEDWMRAAQAICTTDTFPKLISRTFTLPSHPDTEYRIAGMTKGAGMIRPNMATLLAIVCTDVAIDSGSMTNILKLAANQSFNSISIDGDTSTNDTVAFFANGAASPSDVKPLKWSHKKAADEKDAKADREVFIKVLNEFMVDLAKLVVRDGEGATKFVTIRVQTESHMLIAKRAAISIATSSLVKTALYGKDANWGRILCAIGYAPGIMDSPENPRAQKVNSPDGKMNLISIEPGIVPEHTSVSFIPTDGSEELKLLVRGEPEQVDEGRAKEILEAEDLEILVKLNDKPETEGQKPSQEAVVWTCDFSHEYVTINGDYRT